MEKDFDILMRQCMFDICHKKPKLTLKNILRVIYLTLTFRGRYEVVYMPGEKRFYFHKYLNARKKWFNCLCPRCQELELLGETTGCGCEWMIYDNLYELLMW
jgi:hypothetical protein